MFTINFLLWYIGSHFEALILEIEIQLKSTSYNQYQINSDK